MEAAPTADPSQALYQPTQIACCAPTAISGRAASSGIFRITDRPAVDAASSEITLGCRSGVFLEMALRDALYGRRWTMSVSR